MHAVAAEKWKAESTTLNKAKQLKKRQATILKKLKGFVAQVEQGTLKVMIAKQNLVHAQLLDAKNIIMEKVFETNSVRVTRIKREY